MGVLIWMQAVGTLSVVILVGGAVLESTLENGEPFQDRRDGTDIEDQTKIAEHICSKPVTQMFQLPIHDERFNRYFSLLLGFDILLDLGAIAITLSRILGSAVLQNSKKSSWRLRERRQISSI